MNRLQYHALKLTNTAIWLFSFSILSLIQLAAQNPGFIIEGTGFGTQQRITDQISGNSLVLQGGEGENLKITGYNYEKAAAQSLFISVDGGATELNANGGTVVIGYNKAANVDIYGGNEALFATARGNHTGRVAIVGALGPAPGGFAGWFNGTTRVNGELQKSSGSFIIDHPLYPENQYLLHSFVESPDMKNIYDGLVTTNELGHAEVVLPEWFEALNIDFRYQLTCLGQFAEIYVSREIENNKFEITSSKPFTKVSWQVTGIRNDPYARDHRIQVEEDKLKDEVGTYLYPKGYDKSDDYLQPLLKPRKGTDWIESTNSYEIEK